MNINPTSLYILDNKNTIREWSIGVESDMIVIRHGVFGGAMQTQTEYIAAGKAGRTIGEQIMSRLASRIHRQRDKGYSNNIEDAESKPMNSLGLKKPMLAQPIKNIKHIDFTNTFIQPKLDGNRCIIANDDGEIIAYSRNGKRINTLDHILDNISIPNGTILDGEIYCHGETLQTIVSWVKRQQTNTFLLRYNAYDLMSNDYFPERFEKLNAYHLGENVDIVETMKVSSLEEATNFFKAFRFSNYEGAILRPDGFGYEDGKRSKSLIKIKEWLDDEFKVIGIEKSADGWAKLTLEMKNGKQFGVSAPGAMADKMLPIYNPEKYLGRMLRIEYSFLTKDGIPFHPVATNWRDKSDE